MRLLFVIPSGDFTPALPLGVLSIASYLKSHGHSVKICDRMFEKRTFAAIVNDFRPDAIAVSVMSNVSLKDAEEVSAFCRENNITVIWGGQLSTEYAHIILEAGMADIISLGEGEKNLLQLAESFDIGNKEEIENIPGIAIRKNGIVKVNLFAELLCGDELPELDFGLINVQRYFQMLFGTKRMLHLYISKGCPFRCAFCNTTAYGDKKYRRKSLYKVISEIKYLVDVCGADGIYFYDEMFSINKKDAFDFCEAVNALQTDFYWGCYARIGQYTEEELKYFYDSGCRWILFGVESGSEQVRARLNKGIDGEKIGPTFKSCKNVGITTQASFIVGLPGETPEQLKETVDCIFNAGADFYPISNFTLTTGSVIYNEFVASGRVKPVTKFEEIGYGIFPVEKIVENYSEVPVNELKVVRGFFRWCGISGKNSVNIGLPFEAAKDTAGRYIKIIFRNRKLNIDGIADIISVTAGVFSFLFHPLIRKKYGLYKKNFKR